MGGLIRGGTGCSAKYLRVLARGLRMLSRKKCIQQTTPKTRLPMNRDPNRYRNTRSMKLGALVLALLLILPYAIIAIFYPVEGVAMYLRFIGLGLFFGLIYYSVQRERSGRRARPKSIETRVAERMSREARRDIARERRIERNRRFEPEASER